MIQNNEVDISEFIKITNSGVNGASFVQIREALIKKYKEAYGQDIDVSTATADGVFINDLALIINNIVRSFENIYASLDVNTAYGQYLDNLCNLANIQRKRATKSSVSIQITNRGSSPTDIFAEKELILVDTSGTTWSNVNEIPSIGVGEKISILFECDDEGQIQAPKESIYQTVDGSYTNLVIYQPEDAIVGLREETDDELRDRRSQSTGIEGVTVLDSLIGALLEVSGIRDVYIFNNTKTNSPVTMKDGTEVPSHNIYIIIRYEEGVTVEENTIGNIIFDKITPGISTTTSSGTDGKDIPLSIPQTWLGTKIELLDETFHWKKASPVNPKITININTFDNWNDSEKETITNNLIDYLNNLQLSNDLYSQQLLVKIAQFDPLFLGKPSYNVTTVSIEGAENGIYTNKNTYYKYDGKTDIIINTIAVN